MNTYNTLAVSSLSNGADGTCKKGLHQPKEANDHMPCTWALEGSLYTRAQQVVPGVAAPGPLNAAASIITREARNWCAFSLVGEP